MTLGTYLKEVKPSSFTVLQAAKETRLVKKGDFKRLQFNVQPTR